MKDPKYLVALLVVLAVSPIIGHVVFVLLPGAGSFVVASQSMAPSITAGSLIFVVDSGGYDEGDVISFQRDGKVVTHRIVEVNSNHYITKGDANDGRDAPVSHDQVIGKVIFSLPLYGYFFTLASSSIGFLLLVILPSALLIWMELRTNHGE